MAEEEKKEGPKKPEPAKIEEIPKPSIPIYMATFSDMMTLLMCFFVLLFSMSSAQDESYKELSSSLQSALGTSHMPELGTKEGIIKPTADSNADDASAVLGGAVQKEVSEIVDEIRDLIIYHKMTGMVTVSEDEWKVTIRISDNLLFELGNTEIKPEKLEFMEKIVEALKSFGYCIRIEGHTDNTGESPANWKISSLRAVNVVNYLIARGVHPDLLSATGYGEFRPIANNETPEGRAENRRVEIIYNRDDIAKGLAQKRYK